MKTIDNIFRWRKRAVAGFLIGTFLTVGGSYINANKKDDVLINILRKGINKEIKTKEQKESADFLEKVLRDGVEKQDEQKQEEERRTEIKDYIKNSKEKKEELEKKASGQYFTCNYWKDFDQDGIADYPEEYIGIKNKFRDNEKITLVSYDVKGNTMKLEIYNPKGKKIHETEMKLDPNQLTAIRTPGDAEFDMANWLVQKGGYGVYKTVTYIDDKYAGSTEFEIVPSEKKR